MFDLIRAAASRSGGQGELGARGGGAVAGAVVSAAGDRRRKPIPAIQGVIRAGIWSWSTVVACVIHWWAHA